MKLIKLDAIDSTNDFLKGLLSNTTVENLTVVTAETQTKGKGQMGTVWESESGKNLIMSLLIKDLLGGINQIFYLNMMVALAVIEVLEKEKIPDLSIKWPNDIMSYHKKIGGILIENSIKSDGTIFSVVGLGLNVNQTNFDLLPNASSLALVCNRFFDKEQLLSLIFESIQNRIAVFNPLELQNSYTKALFKRGIPMPFSDSKQQKFMGIIQGVAASGMLQILLEDDSIAEFNIKEVQLLY
ncbi:biotin--[acetyl-CoA-carboxylase] ligase [Flavobacterium restrictum]|uniref:Biotin--[acetyl-CoA-carboxylase] ligase n=1 Tax=Flavobacterium restrictum TaxID=2594428 RepID=A0A553DS69_9FLAO|nr:biotin--[acetyl-CoA-carboxylase] ligase [Flavobacterium restrictum]TRX35595.1 biotin--[acetyl-CoA-carboxylase] ligase [Flavobacterium restrictum]